MTITMQPAKTPREEREAASEEAERERAFQALERSLHHPTEAGVQEALTLCRAWLGRHPDDWEMRDAGEPVSMLADALEIITREKSSPPKSMTGISSLNSG